MKIPLLIPEGLYSSMEPTRKILMELAWLYRINKKTPKEFHNYFFGWVVFLDASARTFFLSIAL